MKINDWGWFATIASLIHKRRVAMRVLSQDHNLKWKWRHFYIQFNAQQAIEIFLLIEFSDTFNKIILFFSFFYCYLANLQFRTLPRQPPHQQQQHQQLQLQQQQQQQHLGVNRIPNDNSSLVSVIPAPSSFMSGSIMGHHTIRRSTQSGLVESLPPPTTSMAGGSSFYNRNPTMAISTSQHQQFFYGWQPIPSPVTSALSSPVVPTSILKQSINYQKPVVYGGSISTCSSNVPIGGCGGGGDEDKEKPTSSTNTWVSFHAGDDVCL